MSTTVILLSLLLLPRPTGPGPLEDGKTLDLATAMSDPAWLGAYPERARWTADGRLLFDRRIGDTDERETIEVNPDTGEQRTLSLEERHAIIPPGRWNRSRSMMASERDGDIVIVTPADGSSSQLTRTTSRESSPRWLNDDRLAFQRDGSTMIRTLADGLEMEPIAIRFEEPPQPPAIPEGLAADQRRLFESLADESKRREARRLREEADLQTIDHDVLGPAYLSPDERESGRHLSPDGRWMLLEVTPRNRPDSRRDDMAIWVTEDGYVTNRPLRPKVGTQDRNHERLVLLDLETGKSHDVLLDELPERDTDRLASVRKENREWLERTTEQQESGDPPGDAVAPGDHSPAVAVTRLAKAAAERPRDDDEETSHPSRPISVVRVDWHPDGASVAVMARSLDNKDRWIATIDPRAIAVAVREENPEPDRSEGDPPPITVVEHLFDPGWINWSFNEMGWTKDGTMLWFLSESSGWSNLISWSPTTGPAPMVAGPFEIRSVQEHPFDGTILFRSNRDDPSVWRLERHDPDVDSTSTIAGGGGMVERFLPSPDGSRVAYTESFLDRPAELFVVDLPAPGSPPESPLRLTESASETFAGIEWTPATLVDVPTRHGRDLRGRLHLPSDDAPTLADGRHPAVLFVHGAGYLQNAHAGWTRYFREGFFHDLLAREGFVVLDLDYRASSGYGRDWRTAIARDMGRCELDDYEDGIAWLAERHDVDPERVGIYGGSYGGFTTLMGLFTRPGVFKAGAALRPVTDWAFYNHGYTANILNTPDDDPLAYRRSSPIEHAEGLQDHLLVCHGMIDSNVPYSDTVRLAQRLIELGKSDWEVASYPVEGHGFKETSSWVDEYRRIHELFTRVLWER